MIRRWRHRFTIGVAAAFVAASFPAAAQEKTGVVEEEEVKPPTATPEAGPAKAKGTREAEEEIVVTGSRVRRKDLTTPAPITILNKEQMQASGKATLGDFLQTMPEQGNATNTSVNNGGSGATRVNLRGLGSARTLVLLNGRRFPASGSGADSSVDLNGIPTAAIERVEVLKDGASAVYGSDAIGGVVNIITKKRSNGTELGAFTGVTSKGDGAMYDLNVTTGTAGSNSSILFSGGYFKANSVMAGDRDFSKIPYGFDAKTGVYSLGSGTIPEGRIVLSSAAVGKTVANPSNDPKIALYNQLVTTFPSNNSFIRDPSSALGWRPFAGTQLSPKGDGFNFQPDNYLVTPSQRIQLFSIGDTKLGQHARAFFEASYVNRRSAQQLAAEPLLTDGEGVTVSAQNAYNPFGVDVSAVRRRLNEFGYRTYNQDIDTFRVVGGLDGSLPLLTNWNWETSVNYGRTIGTTVKAGNLKRPNLQAAVGPSFVDSKTGILRCGTPTAPIANCVPLNLFGGVGSITKDQTTNLTFTGTARGTNEMAAAMANVGGELFKLAAERPVAIAIGYEYRMVQGEFIPDPITVAGETTGNKGEITKGRYHVNEGYAELSIPLMDRRPFVDNLELTAAARAFNYSNFGSDATYKFGGLYRPVKDFALRGTYSTAFRAPSISDLFLGQADSFPSIRDPCRLASGTPANCGAAAGNGDDQSQLRTRVGGNPSLKPETAKAFTVGTVIVPRWVPNFTLTVDYFNIKIDQAISTIGASVILANCYPSDPTKTPKYCDFISRDPVTNRIVNIRNTNTNVGGDKTAGLDFAAHYNIPVEGVGRFNFGFDGSWLFQFDRTLADGTVIGGKGTYDLGVFPNFKFLAGVGYGVGPFNVGVNMRYLSRFKECSDKNGDFAGAGVCYANASASRLVPAYHTYDLNASYVVKTGYGKTTLIAGVNNLFNRDPSPIYNGFLAASDPSAYDYIGRYVYFRAGHSF